MFSLKRKQKGFTIVELLIVIVVIGILATLVIVTFTGIQKKARDSQRQTDINATNGQLAAFYTNYGFYPTVADLQTASFLSSYMKGLDPESLKDPKGPSKNVTGGTAAVDQYSYVAAGTGCTNGTASTITAGEPQDNSCDSYTLTAKLESGTDFVKKSN